MAGWRRRAFLTGSVFSSRVAQWTQRQMVKSVQRGSIALNAVTSNTATITSVDVSNTMLRHLGNITNNGGTETTERFVRLTLTNATTITANSGSATPNYSVSYEVIEFYPGVIKSVQRGSILLNGVNTNTATITTVNTAKSTIDHLGAQLSGNTTDDAAMSQLVLTNATTVTASTNTAVTTNSINYQVTEFY